MDDKPEAPQPFSLKRWSQRKRAALRTESAAPVPPPLAQPGAATASPMVETAPAANAEPAALPPVDSLDFESDYAAFMQPKVNEETKRAALKKLFSDPSFNVMDGLDIYTGDYTQADPMPAGMLDQLSAVYAMLDPVKPAPDEQPAPTGNAMVAGETPDVAPAPPAASEAKAAPASEPAADAADASNKSV